MISNMRETNDEITKFIIASFKENEMPINELVLQKVVYKVKMDLGENHPLYDNLPYYWYCYGPFSETLRSSFNRCKKYLNPVGEDYILDDKFINDFHVGMMSEYPEIIESVSDLLSRKDYVYNDLTEDIYKNFAPLNMLHEFKYGIFNPTEYDEFTCDGNAYIKLFRECQRKIPSIPFFQEFALPFTKFGMHIDFLNDDDLIARNWNILKNPIKDLWFTFAQGLRCLEHDSYYDNRYNDWNRIFNDSVLKLDDKINNFINQNNDLIDFSKYDELTDEERNFLAPLIDIEFEAS